ncbi:MAG: hypothetical protein DRJ61_05210 [Acidobacteria bacterium]|nr:MAG: hypothetical protein DRJ61_05210 [Acidobacteriota bacterium]
MAYQTGTFTDFTNLQSIIHSFATANGWTLTAGVLSKGGTAVKITVPDALALQLDFSDAHDGLGSLIDPSPRTFFMLDHYGGPTENSSGLDMIFPVTYHFFEFGASNEIVIVINYNTEYIQQMSFGEIHKYGTWGGGVYGHATTQTRTSYIREYNPEHMAGYASNTSYKPTPTVWDQASRYYTPYPNLGIKCDIDGLEWIYNAKIYNENATYKYPVGQLGFYPASLSLPYVWKVNQGNLQPAFITPMVLMQRPDNLLSVIGAAVNFRHVNISNYATGEILTIGGVKWMVFPSHVRTYTMHVGFAVRYEGP